MTVSERYEVKAEAFRIMTGHMAPGKDPSLACHPESLGDRAVAFTTWFEENRVCVQAMLTTFERIMADPTAHYVTCHCEMDAENQYVASVTLRDTIIEERPPVTITAEAPDDELPHHLVQVFQAAAAYRRVFDEMRHAGMCFKWGTMGPDIAATVLEMWREYRAKFDDRPPIVRTEAEWEAM